MGAVIAIAVAVVCVTGALLTLALALRSAEHARGDQKARGDALDVNLTGLAAQLADTTTREQQALNREKEQRERANKLETAWLAAVAAEPVAGAHARMLAALAAARAAHAHGGDSGDVPDAGPAPRSRVGDTRLLDPGE